MITPTRIGILAFGFAVLTGSLYTVDEYSAVSNVISELGAQHTKNNFIMITAFVILGLAIIVDGVKSFYFSLIPFVLFGLLMVMAGLFPHKPIDSSLNFNQMWHNMHGVLAGAAGTLITIGFIWRGFRAKGVGRWVCFYMAGVAIVFPLLMLGLPEIQGLIQRVMYLQIFSWMWLKYPGNVISLNSS